MHTLRVRVSTIDIQILNPRICIGNRSVYSSQFWYQRSSCNFRVIAALCRIKSRSKVRACAAVATQRHVQQSSQLFTELITIGFQRSLNSQYPASHVILL